MIIERGATRKQLQFAVARDHGLSEDFLSLGPFPI
jgi:hypothetical protein